MTVAEHLAVEGVVKRWHDSLLAKDWNAFAGLYAEDAVLMPPNAPLLAGNRAITAWFANPGVVLVSFALRRERFRHSRTTTFDRGRSRSAVTASRGRSRTHVREPLASCCRRRIGRRAGYLQAGREPS
jgi:hypothetical protein